MKPHASKSNGDDKDDSYKRAVRNARIRRLGLLVAFVLTLIVYGLADGLLDAGDRSSAKSLLRYLGMFLVAMLATSLSVKDEARYDDWQRRRRRR